MKPTTKVLPTKVLQKRILYAAEAGKSRLLVELLIHGNMTDVRDYYGNTPLILTARNGHTKCVKALIDAGADIHDENFEGENALILAAREAHPRVVRLLLERGAQCNPNDIGNRRALALLQPGDSSIYRADYMISNDDPASGAPCISMEGQSELRVQRFAKLMCKVIELLISYGADVDALDEKGSSPLHNFLCLERKDWIQLLLKYSPNLNIVESGELSVLGEAIMWGEHDVARLLLASGADPNVGEPAKPIHIIANLAQPTQILKELIAAGADVNAQNKERGRTALHEVCYRKKDKKEVAQILLDAGANPAITDNNGFTPSDYMYYLDRASDELEDILPFNFGHASLISAAKAGDFDELKAQLREIMPDKIKTLALHKAITHSKYECCQLLLENGADPNKCEIHGLTPLICATYNLDIDVVLLLLSYKADLELANDWGQKALFLTCQSHVPDLPQDELTQKRLRMAELLLERGADVEGADKERWTPLRQAVLSANDIDLTRLLLEHGANPGKKDNSGTSPLQLAEQFCSSKMVELLREYLRH
ncbi:MAG: serine/threonine-protein phosphatase 6 regulatory ankyrin repeat subunit [Geobacteraceae bacterium]|nr:MAG: serine/threonine-protein phosphatase 6 regulatory ankyrin repeat subunit [Geobacteraceae bacterium]